MNTEKCVYPLEFCSYRIENTHFMHETEAKIIEAIRLATHGDTWQQNDAKCISLFCMTHFVF